MERTATGAEAGEGTRRRRRTIATYAVATLLLFAAPGPMVVMAAFAAAVAVLALPVVFLARRDRLRRQLARAGRCVAFLLFAWALMGVNFHLAEARMQRLVDAVHAYRDAHGAYPETLAALVPAQVERVPRATLWLTMNRFRWNGQRGLLTCIPAPPIGWIGYDFETESRAALD